MRLMVDSALVWISLTALSSGIGAVAFVLHYAQANEFDYAAVAIAVVFGGGVFELGMANGYLPEGGRSTLSLAVVSSSRSSLERSA